MGNGIGFDIGVGIGIDDQFATEAAPPVDPDFIVVDGSDFIQVDGSDFIQVT